jgi:GNAT superfamily N-acetyltransferase
MTATVTSNGGRERVTDERRADGQVRVLGDPDLDEAAVLLARGFAEEPGNRALLPDPELRRRALELGARMQISVVLPYATVHGVDLEGRLAGIAVWHPPQVEPKALAALPRFGLDLVVEAPVLARGTPHVLSVVRRHLRATPRLIRARSRAVKEASRGPAWYLAILATDPDARGRGLARLLLDHVLDRCDEDGLAAWLETTDPVNPPLYEHFGFRSVLHLEDAAWLPGYWVMRREPTPGGPH